MVSARVPQVSTGRALRNVQALRAVAAMMVVVAHVGAPGGFEDRAFGSRLLPWVTLPGTCGVDLFFVISGLIMTVTTSRSWGAPGSARKFLWRRATRIYPMYWLVSTLILIPVVVNPATRSRDAADGGALLSSYLLLPQEGRKLLLVGWTLVYEMYFYLLFAVAIRLGRRWFGWVIAGWTMTTMVLNLIPRPVGDPYLDLVSSPLNVEFVLGVLIGCAVIRRTLIRPRLVFMTGVVAAGSVLVGLALSDQSQFVSGRSEFDTPISRVLGPGLAMALVVYGAVGLEIQNRNVAPAFLQRWGDASYSLYLIHLPLLTLLGAILARVLVPVPALRGLGIVAAPACALVAALVSYRLFESPIQNFFHRSTSNGRIAARHAVRIGRIREAEG